MGDKNMTLIVVLAVAAVCISMIMSIPSMFMAIGAVTKKSSKTSKKDDGAGASATTDGGDSGSGAQSGGTQQQGGAGAATITASGVTTPTPQTGADIKEGKYIIVLTKDCAGNAYLDGSNPDVNKCQSMQMLQIIKDATTSAQAWQIKKVSGSTNVYTIQNDGALSAGCAGTYLGERIDSDCAKGSWYKSNNGATCSGSSFQWYSKDDSDKTKWRFEVAGSGAYRIVSFSREKASCGAKYIGREGCQNTNRTYICWIDPKDKEKDPKDDFEDPRAEWRLDYAAPLPSSGSKDASGNAYPEVKPRLPKKVFKSKVRR